MSTPHSICGLMALLCRPISAVLLGMTLVGAAAANEDTDPLVAWLQQQRTEITTRIARLREQGIMVERILADARKSHLHALENGNAKAAETYATAIANAREALEKNKAAQMVENERLAALIRARDWRSMPHLQVASADAVPAAHAASGPPRSSFGVPGVVRGDVQIKTAAGWIKYDPTRPILPGDEVKTGPRSYAEVLFTDGSRMRMDENSSFRLHKLDEQISIYDAMQGRFHATVACMKQRLSNLPEGLMATLPCQQHYRGAGAAPGAVTGTEFVMEVDAAGRLTVTVFEGSFAVQLKDGEKSLNILAGECAVISGDRRIESHGPFEPDKIGPWWRSVP